jgi:hypothetical protein
MGFTVLPVTVIDGTRTVVGFDPRALNEALGIQRTAPGDLSAAELLEKYRVLYAAATRAVLQIPDDKLDWVTPQKERRGQTLRQLAFHLFDRPAVCMDAARTGRYTYDMCHEYEHLANSYRTVREIVDYGEVILARLEAFLTSVPDPTEKVVETYFGARSVGTLLNMALAGLALRIRQTYYFQRAIGIEPDRPLEDDDFSGIQVPKKIFG